ncbi:MAG: VanZ family protein [Lachnospiraceae bacterium]|nr:VanZ family protein [Lachnospiraceae bacterium]
MQKKEKIRLSLFIIYSVAMLLALFIRPATSIESAGYWENVAAHFNPIPFETILYFNKILGYNLTFGVFAQVLGNLIGNVLFFVPFGFFLFGIKEDTRRPFWKIMLFSSVTIIIIELLQMFTLVGYCDIDDLILNEVGVALGYLTRKIFS